MSGTTVRKLRRMGNGSNSESYLLLPPLNWLDAVEKVQARKIQYFTVRTNGDALVLSPGFENPKVVASPNSSSDDVAQMLREGNLVVKLRNVPKGRNVYRVVHVPRVWVRAKERQHNRKVVALKLKIEPAYLEVTPIYGEKLKKAY